MTYFILSLVCVFLAGFLNSSMDTVMYHFENSVFSKLNPRYWGPNSWSNKYIDNNVNNGRKKIFGIVIPSMFTDWWHLAKFFMVMMYSIAIILISLSSFLMTFNALYLCLFALLYWWIFGVGFTLGWDYLLNSKFWDKLRSV